MNSSGIGESNTIPAGIYVAAAGTKHLSTWHVCCIDNVAVLALLVGMSDGGASAKKLFSLMPMDQEACFMSAGISVEVSLNSGHVMPPAHHIRHP